MPYNFIADFLEFGSGSECPTSLVKWASLFPLSVAAGRRYFAKQGRFIRGTNLCLVIVGPSGGKKSYAKDLAKDLIVSALPNMPVAADLTSRDDLIRLISAEETQRFYINYEGAECEWHPVALFVDEIRHFMSYSPSAMIAFLVAIYGQKYFKCSTIKRKVEELVEPSVNLIGCTTLDWITEHLRSGILAGGWSRRFIVLYEPRLTERCISWPVAPANEKELTSRMQKHLQKIEGGSGEFIWEPEAIEYFDQWYRRNKAALPDDEHLRAYYLTKDMHLVTICELVCLADENPRLVITKDVIDIALSFFDLVELNLPRLYLSGGRNELALPQQRLLELLEHNGGGMRKKELMRRTQKDISPTEMLIVSNFLRESGQVLSAPVQWPDNPNPQETIMLPKKYIEVQKNNGKWVNGEPI